MKNNALLGLEILTTSEENKIGAITEGLSGTGISPYDIIRDKIIHAIETQDKKWIRSWAAAKSMNLLNYSSKTKYKGINSFFLGSFLYFSKENNPFFLTYKQALELGGNVKKGAQGIPIFYWSENGKGKGKIKVDPKTGKPATGDLTQIETEEIETSYKYKFLKYYSVFHASDIEGIDWKGLQDYVAPERRKTEIIESAESMVQNMPNRPHIESKDQERAFYSPSRDLINMPAMELFTTDQEFYGTQFHELAHSTGHPSRLNRKGGKKFGDKAYAFEELVAEISAAFLCGHAGILNFTFENSAAYLKGWQKNLIAMMNEDKNFIIKAAKQAELAANYILDIKEEEKSFVKSTTVAKAQVSRNIEKKGIEVLFDGIPNADQTALLKQLGFKYSPKGKLWYAPFTPHTYIQVKDALGVKEGAKQGVKSATGVSKKTPSNQMVLQLSGAKRYDKEIGFIKRFIKMHQKRTPIIALSALVESIQGAIIGKSISKTSPYAPEVMEVQTKLVKAYNHAIDNTLKFVQINLNVKDLEKYQSIVSELGCAGKKCECLGDAPEGIETDILAAIEETIPHAKLIFDYRGYTIELPHIQDRGYGIVINKDGEYIMAIKGTMAGGVEVVSQEAERMVDEHISNTRKGARSALKGVTKNTPCEVHKCLEPTPEQVQRLSGEGEDDFGFVRGDKKVQEAKGGFALTGEIGKLIQRIKPYRYLIALTGPKGGGKTQVTYQIADAFADSGREVAILSLEQGGLDSEDTQAARDRNVQTKNFRKLHITGDAPKGIDTVKAIAKAGKHQVIIIDSWQKLRVPSTRMDELRQEFPEIIWVVIFQQNSEGGTRGGVASEYDANAVLVIHKVDKTFVNNWIELDKNRGNALDRYYMISEKKTYNGFEPEEKEEATF